MRCFVFDGARHLHVVCGSKHSVDLVLVVDNKSEVFCKDNTDFCICDIHDRTTLCIWRVCGLNCTAF